MKRQGYYIALICILLVLTGAYLVRTEIFFHIIKYTRETGIRSDYPMIANVSAGVNKFLSIQITMNRESLPTLIKYLGKSNSEDTFLAYSLLREATFGDDAEYIKLLKTSQSQTVKELSARLLTSSSQNRSRMSDILTDILNDNTADTKTKLVCLRHILDEKSKKNYEILIKLLEDKEPQIRSSAIMELGADEKYCSYLKPLFKETDKNVRNALIETFQFNAKNFYPDMLIFLDDKDPEIVRETLEAASPYADLQAIPYLKRLKESSQDAEIKAQAGELIDKIEKTRKKDAKFSRNQ